MTDFEWDPDSYLALMAEDIADYTGLQQELINATTDLRPHRILNLGTGSGETARRLVAVHPGAQLVGVDASADMLATAAAALDKDRVTLRRRLLQDPLPAEPFDLVVSALGVHHLRGPAKANLFARVAGKLRTGGRFVLADLVVPERAEDAFTHIDWVEDLPSSAAEQLAWLDNAGFDAQMRWAFRDLVVIVADRRA